MICELLSNNGWGWFELKRWKKTHTKNCCKWREIIGKPVQYLIDHGIDIHKNDWNKTPLTVQPKEDKRSGPSEVLSSVNNIDRNKTQKNNYCSKWNNKLLSTIYVTCNANVSHKSDEKIIYRCWHMDFFLF